MGAARQRAFEQRGIDVAADGTGGVRTAVYASAETHHTIQRAAGVLGIGRSNVRMVGTDDRQRMRPDMLREAIARDLDDGVLPIAVVGTAGTTNTGAIDPLRELGELAHEHGVWFHVDGAYGLPGILDERVAHLYDGLELADSAIVDPHKWLNAPVGVAATFVRGADLLFRAFTQEPAAYLEDVQSGEGEGEDVQYSLDSMGVLYSEFGVELSSPSRGVVVWSILRELGRDGVAARVSDDNGFARRLADHVRREPHLELLTEPTLSIVCFRYVADDVDDLDGLNDALLRRLQRETPYLPSSTRVDGVYAIRPCFINPRTTPGLVDGFAAAAVRLGDELRATWPTRG
jgi:aromatic-L-amino-acid decarboxylase